MNKNTLREVVIEQQNFLQKMELGITRNLLSEVKNYLDIPHAIVVSGLRRVGKSTLLAQILNQHYSNQAYYINFEDERLLNFQAEEFNALYEVFVELFGERKVFFLDEVQNIQGWEFFVRRMIDRNFKFFITGSNASLLSKELGTKLTGRCIVLNLLPFSFKELLRFKKVEVNQKSLLDTTERSLIIRQFNEYLKFGGIPLYWKYQDISLLKNIYENIIYRDIVSRYNIQAVKALRELAFYYYSNTTQLISYNKLKQMLQLGSVNTVKNFTEYLENSFLIYSVCRYNASLKQQNISNKKIFTIDNGLVESVAFQFSDNKGTYLENLVFLELKRQKYDIFYYKTSENFEVDFLIKQNREIVNLIQVSENIDEKRTEEREIRALISAMNELDLQHTLLLTYETEKEIRVEGKHISVKPIYRWLLES